MNVWSFKGNDLSAFILSIFSLTSSIECLIVKRNRMIIFTLTYLTLFSSVQFISVAHSCPTLCNPMNHSMPGLPVHHQLPEFTQTHVHQVGDAIQPSHPLSSPSPPAPNPSQHQSFPMSQLFT